MIMATGEKAVRGFIEFELIKLAERINVSGNLTDSQVEFIALQLVSAYPNETIADFKICFERGAAGRYGKIYKLDGVEIGIWMSGVKDDYGNVKQIGYLDEKYQVIENQLMQEKDEHWKKPATQNLDLMQLWKEAVEKVEAEGGVKTQSQNLSYLNHVRAITDKEVKAEGQEKPKPRLYPYTPESVIVQREWHIQWIQENHDPHTGKPLPGWISEEEFLKTKG